MKDTIYRSDAIEAVAEDLASVLNVCTDETKELAEHALSALPSAEVVSREGYNETDGVIEIEKQSAKDVGEIKCIVIRSPNYTRYFYNESMPISAKPQTGELISRAEPTVIRSRTLMPTKDFMEWAKRIKEVNPNAVVIPCDAEVASAKAIQVVRCKDCRYREPDGEITHFYLCRINERSVDDDDYCAWGEESEVEK